MGMTNISYVLPNDIPEMAKEGNRHYDRHTKTLYLLHGFSGNDCDWQYNGIAEDLAADYNLNIFMVSAGNNFYLNRSATGCQYEDFMGKEVVEYTRKTFGLSRQREDTYIGGLSMGGYGAMHTALAYPENFAAAICLSSALIVHQITGMRPGTSNEIANYDYYRMVFGDLSQLDQTETNPEIQWKNLREKGTEIPRIYMAIGTEDFLYQDNQITRQFFEKHDAEIKYEEGPGIHDWKFWNQYVRNGIEWVLGE